MYEKVVGGKVMLIGDLHFSDVFTGKHKNYLANCFWVLGSLDKRVHELRPSAIVLLGDIIGWTETNVRNREVLSKFCKVLQGWNDICPVYALQGNHDVKGYPDFLFLSELGLLITDSTCGGYFDYYGYDGEAEPEVRFHLVNYGSEGKALNIYDSPNCLNIVLGHNNFTIQGLTTWYSEHDGLELCMMQNFSDVDMVVSGHIHNPSPEILSTTMPSGKQCMLFYTGCPTRPIKDKNIYDMCYNAIFEYKKENDATNFHADEFKLQPLEEVFYSDDFITDKSEDEIEEEVRKENLHEVLGDLLKYRISMGDPIEQVKNIPNASDEAKAIAIQYLQIAFNKAS